MKKTSMIALLAMFLTASLTFAAGSIQATAQDDPPVLDCWSTLEKMEDQEAPDMSIARDCPGALSICCYTPNNGQHGFEVL